MAPAIPLDMMREPPATRIESPAPNVIITVDDSAQASEDELTLMRASLRHAFASETLADGSIRLAYQAMTSCAGFEGNCTFPNNMRPLEGQHRQQFQRWIAQLKPLGERRSLNAIDNVGEYLRTTGVSSPWAHLPGQQQNPEHGCRRAFHLFLSSGGSYGGSARDPGNHDNQPRLLPDGRNYQPIAPYAHARGNTISDLTFHYWASDLRPNLTRDAVPTHMPVSAPLIYAGTTLAPYWHPQNDPASWRHLTTHVLGFGAAANLPAKDLGGLITGITPWTGDATEELRHMAFNGRGEFLAAIDEHVLSSAMTRLLRPPARPAGFRATGAALSANDITAGDLAFVSGYDASDWQGSFQAFPITGTGTSLQTSDVAAWSAAQRLASRHWNTGRVIVTSQLGGGIPFRWANLSAAPPTGLDADGLGERRIAYLRGNPEWDGSLFRQRGRPPGLLTGINVLGDIVSSQPRAVLAPAGGRLDEGYGEFFRTRRGRPGVVYVGANDGMLHGFDTATGDERIAYIPRGVHDQLVALTRPDYAHAHRFYVDGAPLAGDVRLGGRWHTLLAGSLGLGGKGYFVLDVTDPEAFTERNAQKLVLLDNTAAADDPDSDPDLGFMTSMPSVDALTGQPHQLIRARHPSGERRWALLLGNGASSRQGDAVLLVQFLEGSRELIKVPANESGGNGMVAIRPVDLDGDETADAVYGGDMRGNLWRFDLSGSPSQWRAEKIYTARSTSDSGQAISSAPIVGAHPLGGLLIGFATGQLLYHQDREPQYNTLYGIWDRSAELQQGGQLGIPDRALAQGGRARLIEQRVGDGAGVAPISYSSKNDSPLGWFIDLPDPQDRSLQAAAFLFRQGSEAFFSLEIERLESSRESCTGEAPKLSHSRLAFGLHSGGPPAVLQRWSTLYGAGTRIVRSADNGQPYALTLTPPPRTNLTAPAATASQVMSSARLTTLPNPEMARRLSWRQLR